MGGFTAAPGGASCPSLWPHLQHHAQMLCSARGCKQPQTQEKAPGGIAKRTNGLSRAESVRGALTPVPLAPSMAHMQPLAAPWLHGEALHQAPGGSVF